MAKKMNFRNDMKEAKAPEVNVEETERLPTEKGYTRTKRKLKGTKNNEQTLRHGKKPIEKKQSGKLKSAVVSQQLHRKIAEVDEDDNIGVESVNRGVQAAEAGADVARGTVQKVKKYGNKLHDRAVKPEISAEKETLRHVEEEFSEGVKTAATAKTTGAAAEPAGKSNPLSRFMQRKRSRCETAFERACKSGVQQGWGLREEPCRRHRDRRCFYLPAGFYVHTAFFLFIHGRRIRRDAAGQLLHG